MAGSLKLLRQGWPTGRPFPELVLIGSANGQTYVEPVMAILDQDQPVSLVGKLSIRATARLIADCDFFIGPDGGLMHCALGFGIPGLALFGLFKPRLYLPPETKMQALYDLENINNIDPQLVAKKVQEQLGIAV